MVGWIITKQAEFYRAMSAALRAAKTDGSAVTTLLGVSFLYGIFHAAGPGHGKAVISSYLLANEETAWRGVVLSFASALVQALVAVLIVAIAAWLLNATSQTMCKSERVIEIACYALIAALGARLVWTKGRVFFDTARRVRAAAGAPHAHDGHHAHHDHADHDHAHHGEARHDRPHHDGARETRADHAHHAHGEDDAHCGHAHGPDLAAIGGPGGWRNGLGAVLAVGLRPCSGAILVLGARAPAYGSIVASGANACVLHYRENAAELRKGDLLLIDAGCELDSYAADITRTFPVGGRFSPAQKDVYEIVLAAQQAAIRAVRPGADFIAYHEAATRVLVQGLVDLKLCKGGVDKVLEDGSYKQFYMHRTGHWLGLDVHDAGDYMRKGRWRKLAPGMVLTVEPGLYIRAAHNVPRAFWDIGVRIEDDVLVTPKGREMLTSGCPKSVADVEAAVGGR